MERDREHPLSGWIQLDDAYLGCERSGGKRGRGAPGKTPFVAAVQTYEQDTRYALKVNIVEGFRLTEIAAWAQLHLSLRSSPMGWPAFMASPRRAAFMSRWWWVAEKPLSSAPSFDG